MPKFRKKPVVINAIQWFPGKHVEGVITPDPNSTTQFRPWLKSGMPSTVRLLNLGDWIVEENGVCEAWSESIRVAVSDEIFRAAYEPVDFEAVAALRGINLEGQEL